MRSGFGLNSQLATDAVSKAAAALRLKPARCPDFRVFGAIGYGRRSLTWKTDKSVSILTLNGRTLIPISTPGRWLRVHRAQGAARLIHRRGTFYLSVCVEVPEPEVAEPDAWLGVDLGLANIATDSDGTAHSGRGLRNVRARNRALRAKLQSKGTKSAKRLAKNRRRKETRYARDVNHCISKTIVGKAKGTGRGIKLEDLSGIRDRTTVRKAQRADHHCWSFSQLRLFITYKAKLAGVQVVLIDPRNTSRECPACGEIDKRNRRTRDDFRCIGCGFAGPADHIAATNISRRAATVQPNAA